MGDPLEMHLEQLDEAEVGEEVLLDVPSAGVSGWVTWLGTVSSPADLTDAMSLMCQIAEERKRRGAWMHLEEDDGRPELLT